MAYAKLFSPLTVRNLTLQNRLVMPAMGTSYCHPDGSVSERLKAYYAARAAGGVGLIIVEIGSVEYPRGRSALNQLSLHDDSLIPGLKSLVETIHRYDVPMAFQLNHAGKRALREITGVQPVSSSPIPIGASESGWYDRGGDVPEELTVPEIKHLVSLFADAARRAKEAGADAVEIHGAHGYLINQFLSPYSNRRTDSYGGDSEGRSRFASEVVKEIRTVVGENFPILFRVSAWEGVEGGLTLDSTISVVKILEKAGVDIFNVSAGSHDSMYLITPPSYVPLGHILHLAEGVKKAVSVPVITVGRINEPGLAERIIQEGKADLVAIGRALIADPEFPNKAKTGRAEEIRRCIWCNQGCVGRLRRFDSHGRGMMTCTVNPGQGKEGDVDLQPVQTSKKILVIGGGPAGLEASLAAAIKGHHVILYEREPVIGGQMRLALKPPFKSEIESVIAYYRNQLREKGVQVRLGKEVTLATVKRVKPNVVLIATGATPLIPRIDGVNQDNVVTAWDVIAGKARVGNEVVVLGGGGVGCETAHFLAQTGKVTRITVIEALAAVASELEINRRHYLRQNLNRLGVVILTESQVEQIRGKEVLYRQGNGATKSLTADTVVLSLGAQPYEPLSDELRKQGFEVRLIGDCFKPRDMLEAIADGFNAALQL